MDFPESLYGLAIIAALLYLLWYHLPWSKARKGDEAEHQKHLEHLDRIRDGKEWWDGN